MSMKLDKEGLLKSCANIMCGISVLMLSLELIAALLGKPSFFAIITYLSWLGISLWIKAKIKRHSRCPNSKE